MVGKDRMIMATELLNSRIKDIMCLRAKQGLIKGALVHHKMMGWCMDTIVRLYK